MKILSNIMLFITFIMVLASGNIYAQENAQIPIIASVDSTVFNVDGIKALAEYQSSGAYDVFEYLKLKRLYLLSRSGDPANAIYRRNSNNISASYVPSDPYYSSSILFEDYNDMWGLQRINAEDAWDISKGEDVIVAVLDTGVDVGHFELLNNLWMNELEYYGLPGIDDDGNGFIDDFNGWDFVGSDYSSPVQSNNPVDNYGHGTFVAGIIAADENNEGIIGVAPEAKIMPVKVLDDDGNGVHDIIASGITYAADMGARIINMSLGGVGVMSDAFKAAVDYAYSLGCIIITSAGNDSSDVENFIPASYEKVMAVSASDPYDDLASFSNYGDEIDVAAPGVDILSLKAEGTGFGDSDFSIGDGTSFASPFVAGVAALILADDPTLSNEEVINRIRMSAEDIGGVGFDENFGYGLLDAYNALTMDFNSTFEPGKLEWTLEQMTFDDNFTHYDPDINTSGEIVWGMYGYLDGATTEEYYALPSYIQVYDSTGTIQTIRTTTNEFMATKPKIADNGDVVWRERVNPYAVSGELWEIFLYDRSEGTTQQLSNTPEGKAASEQSISDSGNMVAWVGYENNDNNSDIFIYDGQDITNVSNSTSYADSELRINNNNQAAWLARPVSGINPDAWDVFFYNGTEVVQLTDDDIKDRDVQINDLGNISWLSGSYFSGYNLFVYDGSVITQITTDGSCASALRMNNNNQMVWIDADGELIFYDGTDFIQITDNPGIINGHSLQLNDLGQIVWCEVDLNVSNIFIYANGEVNLLSTGNGEDLWPVLNNDGNVVFYGDYSGDFDIFRAVCDRAEYYGEAPKLIKRITKSGTGDIFEYLNEDWDTQGFGRVVLNYDASQGKYYTYSWGTTQVTLDEYIGDYEPAEGSDVHSDVIESERTVTYIYDHNGAQGESYDFYSNRLLREIIMYDTNGVTIIGKYEYDLQGEIAIIYEYYGSERLYTKEVMQEEVTGEFFGKHVTYLYKDEAFYDNGTPSDTSDDYGRTELETNHTDGYYWYYIYSSVVPSRVIVKVKKDLEHNVILQYDYYDNTDNRLKAKAIAFENDPDGDGIADTPEDQAHEFYGKHIVYEYMDEPFYDNGTPSDPGDDYGRTQMATNITDGYYWYYIYGTVNPDRHRVRIKKDLSNNMMLQYDYYDNTDNRLNAKAIAFENDPDRDGIADTPEDQANEFYGKHMVYEHMDEPFYDNGTPSDPGDDYGRTQMATNITDGYYWYYIYGTVNPDRHRVRIKKDLSNNMVLQYDYYDNTDNRLKAKAIAFESDPDGDGIADTPEDQAHEFYGKHIVYEYMDEAFYDNGTSGDTSDDYGRTQIVTNVTDGYYWYYIYGTVNPDKYRVEIKKDLSNNVMLQYDYYDNADNRLKAKLVVNETDPDGDGVADTAQDQANEFYGKYIVYEYMDEAFYDNGTSGDTSDDYGRLQMATNLTDGYYWYYVYSAAEPGRVLKRIKKDLSNTLIVSYEYYDNENNRLYTKEIVDERDPDGDGVPDEDPDDTEHELYQKHVRYYYIDEDNDPSTPGDQQGISNIEILSGVSGESTMTVEDQQNYSSLLVELSSKQNAILDSTSQRMDAQPITEGELFISVTEWDDQNQIK